ncbi:ABC transporter ATP-binding protein [Flavobacteriaceae bacterium F08102]|nr:ABC transporter ATP-binding protein [Flavobacteriaceae bacterium F08102]
MIHINQVSKQYPGAAHYAVQDLSLEISEGEIYGLLGPNGAGKTTLISMLCGLLKPDRGTISLNGHTYRQNASKIKQIIGVVPQEYALYPMLTAYENLQYFGAMYGIKGADLRSKIEGELAYLGLEKFAHKKIKTFSGGMKRRVNLIAGILHEPTVLFLDEPTVGVDVQSKNVIIEHLKNLNQRGTTIIYTSHHLIEAEDFCSHLSILDHGKIIISGSPKALIQQMPAANNLEDVFISLTGAALRDHV